MSSTAAAWAGVVIAALTLAWAVTFAMLRQALKMAAEGATQRQQMIELGKDMADLVADKDRAHQLLAQQMSDDRKATDRRLRWLEEHLWTKGQAS